jgi:AcrR family transcriptional regulator
VTRRKTQDERSEQTRERLLSAAVKILSKQGYANFRIAEVSNVSGVSRGGMIHHYPSKDALVAGALEYIFARLQQRSKTELNANNDTPSILRAIVESGADFFFGPEFPIYLDLVLATRRRGPLPTTFRALARRQSLSIEEFWASSLVAQGIDEGIAKDVVGLVWNLLRGLAIKAIGTTDTETRQRVINFALHVVEAYLKDAGPVHALTLNKESVSLHSQ